MEPRKDHLVGSQVGEYVIEERIGLGGMGVVYRASQKRIGKQVAIKVLRAEVMDDPREMERFLDEARAVNAVSHRGIISIFGAGELADGRQYLVMEYLKGESLEQRLHRAGRLPASEVISVLEEVVSALSGVHAAGIVHRDLKPANVFLVEQSDGKPWVKLLDFGLARRGERTDVSRIAGTPDYLSPEHSRGLPPGPASDFYSMGVMTFHLLTGQLPFAGRSALEVMEKHVYSEPPSALALEPSIPQALNELLTSLMRKEPGARPQVVAIRTLLKTASRQARSATTQPGGMGASPDVLAVRAAAAAEPTAPMGKPLVEGETTVPTRATDALFETLPPALAGIPPSDSQPIGTPSPGVSPQVAKAQLAARSSRLKVVLGLAAAGAVVGVLGFLASLPPSIQAIDRNANPTGAVQVNPVVDVTRNPTPGTPDPNSPPDRPALPVDPDGEQMPVNPAEVASDGGH